MAKLCEKLSFWRIMDSKSKDSEYPQFVEVDPTGRYGRYNEILGMGASKTVYKGFDEYEGIEVAWNQVKLNKFLRSSEDLERLYCEIHLLKTLKHKNIMKFYASWVNTSKRKINFVTEMFTSGTLRQYRQKHRWVNIRALKHWCRQILNGLLYLHSHNPPIIHRDLKCDNIFVNGNQGEIKIGDLGLAAILRKPLADHCVGTPEFMAPEVYEEAYNELVDIYSFGMCVLEMVTLEYPYSECSHPVEIYKKVISGRKPDAFYKVKNPEVRKFVEKCLAKAPERFSARELLNDPFLQTDEPGPAYWEGDANTSMSRILSETETLRFDEFHSPAYWEGDANTSMSQILSESETLRFDEFHSRGGESHANLETTIQGMRRDDGSIFLSIGISDREGNVRNIFFPFNIEIDSALGVAAEMVEELNITDYDIKQIAELIDGEVSSLVSEWQPDFNIGEIANASTVHSVLSYLSVTNESGAENLHSTPENLDCSLHGRFGEITYHVKESECGAQGASIPSPTPTENLFKPPILNKKKYHKETFFEKYQMESGDHNEIRTLSGNVYKTMKSFHFGRNFSFLIPSNDGLLHGDASNDGINKKYAENGTVLPKQIISERG